MSPMWRVVVLAIALHWVGFAGIAGEPIIFSKPDREISAPRSARESRLPAVESESRSFQISPPQNAVPYSPPPVAPSLPRKTERRTLFDEPDLFSDKSQRNGDTTRSQQAKPFPWATFDPLGNSQQDRALSPIRQYDWMPETSEKGSKGADPRHRFDSGLFSRSGDDDRNPRSDALSSFFEATPKRELRREDLERKAEFEKLLNPQLPAMSVRNGPAPSPATPFQSTRPPAPMIAPVETPTRRSLDPMQDFNDQQQRWRGPSMEDLNRKAFGTPAPKQARSAESPDSRPPLMRQPTFQDFPGRKF